MTQSNFRVSSGLVAIEIELPQSRRQILSFEGVGDCFIFAIDMALPALQVRAIVPSMLLQSGQGANAPPQGAHRRDAHAMPHRPSEAWLQAAILGRLSAEERVASFMLQQAYRERTVGSSDLRFTLLMTRQDIADYLGLNPDTLSRVLSRLQADGVIVMRGRSDVRIPDPARLDAMSPIAAAIKHRRRVDWALETRPDY